MYFNLNKYDARLLGRRPAKHAKQSAQPVHPHATTHTHLHSHRSCAPHSALPWDSTWRPAPLAILRWETPWAQTSWWNLRRTPRCPGVLIWVFSVGTCRAGSNHHACCFTLPPLIRIERYLHVAIASLPCDQAANRTRWRPPGSFPSWPTSSQ